VYSDGGSKASLYFILRGCWKNENRFDLSNQLEKHWAPRRHYTQAASIERVKFALVNGRSAGPLRRGARLEDIGQIGLKWTLLGTNPVYSGTPTQPVRGSIKKRTLQSDALLAII